MPRKQAFPQSPLTRFLATSNGRAFTARVSTHDQQTDTAVANPRHARHCAFLDDFVLVAKYAQHWEWLGNSVPPLMTKAIAGIIRDKVLTN